MYLCHPKHFSNYGASQTTIKNFTQNPKNDILSGLTVALALVPEAVAFALAGVDPLVGLYGAFMMGLIPLLEVVQE